MGWFVQGETFGELPPYKKTSININIHIHTKIYTHPLTPIKKKKVNNLRAIALGMTSQTFNQIFAKFIHKPLVPNFTRFNKDYEM